jgi:formylglycine-generating enzyme required for sulfatase activity
MNEKICRTVYRGAMVDAAKTSLGPLGAVLVLLGACGSNHASGGGASGAGGAPDGGGRAGAAGGLAGGSGSGGGGGTGGGGATDGGSGSGGGGPVPPSCAPGGVGLSSCGAGHDSCCTSSLVAGGRYNRTYDPADGGASDGSADVAPGADPASIGDFRLDKYDVTVGRFRQFVKAALAGDGGVGWRPAEGAGKHGHLAGGLGLVDVGADAGVAHEQGWSSADDGNVAPTDANLTSCGAASMWTPTPGAREDRPINCVTWSEAYAFCIWDGGFLPSEAEWEYAAAGGASQLGFPWGATDPGTSNQYAIYDCHYPPGSQDCPTAANIAPVGTATLGAGRWGQLDLAGNQSQWNLDWYAPYVTPCADCARLTGGSSRVLRGGGYGDRVANLRPTYRDANNPTLRNDFIGVRCARSP